MVEKKRRKFTRKDQVNKVELIGFVSQEPKSSWVENRKGRSMERCITQVGTQHFKYLPIEFHDIEVHGNKANWCADNIRKGMYVRLEGSIHYYQYKKNGENRKRTVINTLDIKILDWMGRSPKEEDDYEEPEE